jgi:hypothetical protein
MPEEAAQDRWALGALVLDHDRDVLQPARDVVGQRVERRPNVLVELLIRHQYLGASGGRIMNSRTVKAPKAKPPMCAKNATPPPASGRTSENPPSQI